MAAVLSDAAFLIWQVLCWMQCHVPSAQPDGKNGGSKNALGCSDPICTDTATMAPNDGMKTCKTW